MEYRTRTGERLSEIGVDCYGFRRAYAEKDPHQCIEVIHRAHEVGVTFFDIARIYGPGEELRAKPSPH